MRRTMVVVTVPLVGAVLTMFGPAGVALAGWSTAGGGGGSSRALAMPAGSTPTTSATGRNVTVSWTAGTFSTGMSVSGYTVQRYDGVGTAQTIGAACTGTVAGLTCTEAAVPAGSWRYAVTPRQGGWTGAESGLSVAVAVAAPAFAFSSATTVTSLPTTLSGDLTGFVTGQTVTFRLDNASTGTLLTGNVSQSPIPASGASSVTVTIPAGTADGSHSVYAVGSQGDVASAAITVAIPVARTFTTSAWSLRDASGGTEVESSDFFGFAGDGRIFGPLSSAYGWQPAFNPAKYLDFDYSASLPAGLATAGMQFNFDFRGGSASGTACFYFEVRRVSTGALVAAHGSAAAPLGCVTGATAFVPFSTALPEITSSDLANDMKVRVYENNSTGTVPAPAANYTDRATVSGTAAGKAVTLFQERYTDATSTAFGFNWVLAKNADGWAGSSGTGWATSFSSSKYLKLTYPDYVPTGATGVSASLTHAYKSNTSATTTCYYVEVYAGTTLIGTHGSTTTPVSCNATTSFVTNTIALPEVTTVAQANSLVVRLYMKNSGSSTANRMSQHDVATVTVNYSS